MSNIPPIEDGYIDSVIKSSGPLKPNLNKTQGVELRALVKLLRDRLENEIAEHYAANQAALVQKVGQSEFQSGLENKISFTEKGQANGVATLDVNGKIPVSQLGEAIIGSVNYQGNYDAGANNPPLPIASGNKGKYYIITVSGNQQGLELNPGDWIISNGEVWQKVDNGAEVVSVNGMTGVVNITDVTGNAGTATVAQGLSVHNPNLDDTIVLGYNQSGEYFELKALNEVNNTGGLIVRGYILANNGAVLNAPIHENDIVRLQDVSSGKTIGANTSGSAYRWNNESFGTTNKLQGEFIVYNGTNWINKSIIANSPITWNDGTSSIGLNISAAKVALGINNGTPINNTSANSVLWNGSAFQGGNLSSVDGVMARDTSSGNFGFLPNVLLKNNLGINNGSDLNNNASSSNVAKGLSVYNPNLNDTVVLEYNQGGKCFHLRGVNDPNNGVLTVTGSISTKDFAATSGRISNLPTAANDIVIKQYVDDEITTLSANIQNSYVRVGVSNNFLARNTFQDGVTFQKDSQFYGLANFHYPPSFAVGRFNLYNSNQALTEVITDNGPSGSTPTVTIIWPTISGKLAVMPQIGGNAPSPTNTGIKGQVIITGGYRYECVSTNQWVRSAVETTW